MIYAVIDTNVLVSALLGCNPQSPTVRLFDKLFEGLITPLYNEEILSEYSDVLKRKKFSFDHEQVDTVVAFIAEHGQETSRTQYSGDMPDEDDRVFYEISLSCEESFLVTGNLKHYPVKLHVVTPSEFMNLFWKE